MTRVALVTAASRGIGAACARALAEDGYTVGLLARSGSIHDMAAELGGFAVQGSVTDPPAIDELVDRAVREHGRVDAVVNNTGHPAKGNLLDITDEDWIAGMELMLMNVIRMARQVTPVMQAQGGGSIINISSLWAVEPHETGPVSSTIRAALGAYTKLYADQHAADGIRMNALLPGFVDSYPVPDDILAAIPAGRPARAEEIGKVVVFLASPEAAYINGQSIRADGGLTRSI
jgi:NAD(P)-dependent dehydrogenase (short-subunit alcohol dehydrogenase family)